MANVLPQKEKKNHYSVPKEIFFSIGRRRKER
jgi:hypothetical protein